jgi:hypothetical protein
MKRFLSLMIAAIALAPAAQAAAVCATPQEMKVLQAAVLRQQLAAAAQSCHLGAAYGRFVAAYGAAMVQSDRELKQFFHSRTRAEGYDAYKARIARDVSLKSLHDPGFCRSAETVFDMALHGARPGKKTPFLVKTGYESCRMLPGKPVMAANPAPTHVAQAVPIPRAAPRAAAPRLAVRLPPKPVPAVAKAPEAPPVRLAKAGPPRETPVWQEPPPEPAWEAPESSPAESVEAPRAATPEPGRRAAPRNPPYDPYADGNVPNAYRQGAYWVNEPPPPRRPRPHAWSFFFRFGG